MNLFIKDFKENKLQKLNQIHIAFYKSISKIIFGIVYLKITLKMLILMILLDIFNYINKLCNMILIISKINILIH